MIEAVKQTLAKYNSKWEYSFSEHQDVHLFQLSDEKLNWKLFVDIGDSIDVSLFKEIKSINTQEHMERYQIKNPLGEFTMFAQYLTVGEESIKQLESVIENIMQTIKLETEEETY